MATDQGVASDESICVTAAGGHRMRAADIGFAHVCLATDDLDAILASLEDAGGRRMTDPVEIDGGVNAGGRAVYVRDPDGHVVELFGPSERRGA